MSMNNHPNANSFPRSAWERLALTLRVVFAFKRRRASRPCVPTRSVGTRRALLATLLLCLVCVPGSSADRAKTDAAKQVPDPALTGGEPEGIVQVANLVYAGVKSSHCFSDHFLSKAEQDSAISTSRRFHAVKLASEELFNFPLVIMTGEGAFSLTDAERSNLRQYIERGGFLLASAGCSSKEWNSSFRKEMATVFPQVPMEIIPQDHLVFHMIYDIPRLEAKHGVPQPLEGITMGSRLAVLYSQDGLNDTAHAHGCCCCGGNEITNCIQVNVNILAYALLH